MPPFERFKAESAEQITLKADSAAGAELKRAVLHPYKIVRMRGQVE